LRFQDLIGCFNEKFQVKSLPVFLFFKTYNFNSMKLFYITVLALLINVFPAQAQNEIKTSFHVSGACDALCKPRIEAAAIGRGVQSANWSAETKMLSLVYDPAKTTIQKIQQRIADVGHDVGDLKADDLVYNALP
jgi:hypothetical protein